MLDRLRHTYNSKPNINEEEEIYILGWEIIEEDMLALMNKSWEYQKKGRQEKADSLNESANTLVYLFYYALFIRRHLDRNGYIDNRCAATQVEDEFQISCVEETLLCLSANLDVAYGS